MSSLDEIMDMWEKDSKIDKSELGLEALKGPVLHHKYFKLFSSSRLSLRKMEADFKALRIKKADFYMNGPNDETRALGWLMPPRGRILKQEVASYVDTDPDVRQFNHEIAMETERAEALEDIIKEIRNRGYAIKNAIDWIKFTNGA
jgi:hypothetical protein